MENKKFQIKIGKARLFGMLTVVATLLMLIAPWIKSGKAGLTVFVEDISEIHGCFGAAKVFAIITLIVGIIYFIFLAINFVKLVPGLKKFKFGFNRLFGLVYYSLFFLAILFNIIGCIANDYDIDPTVRVIFIFIFIIGLVVLYAVPPIYNGLSKKIDFVIE